MSEFGDLKTEEQVNGELFGEGRTFTRPVLPSLTEVLTLLPTLSGPETAGHSEAHDAEKTEGGCGEEPGPQGGDHHRGRTDV